MNRQLPLFIVGIVLILINKIEKTMNIIDILKYKLPQTSLYDVVIGAPVYLRGCTNDKILCFYSNKVIEYNNEGKLYSNNAAIQVLTPSKKMKDWSKFAWKEGDILENTSDSVLPRYLTFMRYVDDEYTTFEATKGIITSGKLTTYSIQDTLSYTKIEDEKRVHTVKEKIDKLLREIKAANSPSHTFQPFDKVLVRDSEQDYWKPNLFGFKSKEEDDDYPYATLSCCYAQCIPYNEETKHLLGTTEPYKED